MIKNNNLAYRPDIDGLRALAVISVMIYHAFPSLLSGGFVGVDIFFVISGFLISGIILDDLNNQTFSLWGFYSRRIRRIFPALILVLTAVLIFGWFSLFSGECEALGKHVFGGAFFVSNFFFWGEAGYWDVSAKLKPLLHLWSLGIEEQFYIIFPCILVLCMKKGVRFVSIVFLLLALSFYLNIYYIKRNLVLDFYSPFTRFWELLVGVIISVIVRNKSFLKYRPTIDSIFSKIWPALKICLLENPKILTKQQDTDKPKPMKSRERDTTFQSWNSADLLSLLGFVIIIVTIFTNSYEAFPGRKAVWPVLGTLCLIVSGPNGWINRWLFSNKLVVGIGLISFPLYLWHWPLISFSYILQGMENGIWLWRFIRFGCLFISFILAYLTYKFVERPIRFGQYFKTFKTCLLILLMAMIGCFGFYVNFKDGLNNVRDITEIEILNYIDNKQLVENVDVDSSTTVVVYGDSHAGSAFAGIAELNKSLGINTEISFCGLGSSEVDKQKIFNQIINNAKVKAVFIFYRGVFYLEGKDIDVEYNHDIHFIDFFDRIQDIIDEFTNNNIKVYFVTENPVLSYNPVNYISRKFSLRRNKIPIIYKYDIYNNQKTYLNLVKKIKNATIIYVIDKFCPKDECLVYLEDGKSLYFDDDHLSYAGSVFQSEKILEPYLLQIANDAK